MPTFTAVVTSHQNQSGLRHMLGQLRYQTRPPDETLVFCSDTVDLPRLREDFPEATFIEVPDRQDWGHMKRLEGMKCASSEWVGFFNDDDRYDNAYIERMLAASPGLDVVFCNWNTHPDCGFSLGSSTSGNFIFRAEIAREVSYPQGGYESDGLFIDSLRAKTDKIGKIADVLYFHNEGLRNGFEH